MIGDARRKFSVLGAKDPSLNLQLVPINIAGCETVFPPCVCKRCDVLRDTVEVV